MAESAKVSWENIYRISIPILLGIIGFLGTRYAHKIDESLNLLGVTTVDIKAEQRVISRDVRELKLQLERNSERTYDLSVEVYQLRERISILENELERQQHRKGD